MAQFYILLALVAGMLMPVQAGINSQLKGFLGNSSESAAFVSFAVGTIVLGIYLLVLRLPLPLARAAVQAPVWCWTGGALGAFFVAATVFLAYKLGAATMMGLIVAGQLVASLLLDQFGALGYPVRPISATKAIGVVLLVGGAYLIRK